MKEQCPNVSEKPKRSSLIGISGNPTKLEVVLSDVITSSWTIIAIGSILQGETKVAVLNGAAIALSGLNSSIAHVLYKKNHKDQLTS